MARARTIAGLHDDGAKSLKLWRFAPIGVVAVVLVAGYALGWQHYFTLGFLGESHLMLKQQVADHPVTAPLVFVAVYALAIAVSFPAASVLTIFAGFLFGWFVGGTLAIIAATLGATGLFLIARSAFGGFLRERAGGFAARLAEGFRNDAFAYLLVLRLAPFVPFVAVNIAAGAFGVRPRTFVIATAIGIIPAAMAYAWLGQGVESVLVAAQAAGHDVSVRDLATPEIKIAFVALAGVTAIAVVAKKIWSARRGRE